MDINKLKAFVAVCNSGSYTKVANDLGYTHAGIAYMIKSLEEEIGFSLIEKNGHHVVPTGRARMLMPDILNVIRAMDALEQSISTHRASMQSTLTIGTIESASVKWVPLAVERFREMHPNVPTNILNGDPFEINQWIRDDIVDIGVSDGTWHDSDYVWRTLTLDRFYGMFPRNTKHNGAVRLEDFEDQYVFIPNPTGNRTITQLLADHHVHVRHPLDKTILMPSVISNVATGRGVAITTGLMLDISNHLDMIPELTPTIIPIEPAVEREIGVTYKHRLTKNPLIMDFVRCLRQTIEAYPIHCEAGA